MLPPYNNNNQGLGLRYDSTIPYVMPKAQPNFIRGATGMNQVSPVPTSQRLPRAVINTHTPAIAQNKAIAPEKSWSDSLGDYWQKGKETVWGSPVSTLGRDASGNFNTAVMDDAQWEAFFKKGGNIGANGQLYNADGSAFDVTSLGADASKFGSATEGGLGDVFSRDNIKAAGDAAKTLGYAFSAYQAGDDIFGRGARSRREAERQAKADFEQRYAMNKMTMEKFQEDNERFKRQRENITSSY